MDHLLVSVPSSKHCPHSEHCELYPLFLLRASLRTWQIRYCKSDYSICHRFQLAEKGQRVPANLLPNGKSLPVRGNSILPLPEEE